MLILHYGGADVITFDTGCTSGRCFSVNGPSRHSLVFVRLRLRQPVACVGLSLAFQPTSLRGFQHYGNVTLQDIEYRGLDASEKRDVSSSPHIRPISTPRRETLAGHEGRMVFRLHRQDPRCAGRPLMPRFELDH